MEAHLVKQSRDPRSSAQLTRVCVSPQAPSAGNISVGIYGDVTLLGNSPVAITLSATIASGCASSSPIVQVQGTSVYANLDPVELDVDLGEAFGLQMQNQIGRSDTPAVLQSGSSFNMDVRVNSASYPLIAFEVRLLLSYSHVIATHTVLQTRAMYL